LFLFLLSRLKSTRFFFETHLLESFPFLFPEQSPFFLVKTHIFQLLCSPFFPEILWAGSAFRCLVGDRFLFFSGPGCFWFPVLFPWTPQGSGAVAGLWALFFVLDAFGLKVSFSFPGFFAVPALACRFVLGSFSNIRLFFFVFVGQPVKCIHPKPS